MKVVFLFFFAVLVLTFIAILFLIAEVNNKASELMEKEETIDELKKELEKEKKKRKDLEEISETDILTRLPNRRAFETFIKRHWKRHAWERSSMAIVVADINNFKIINDTRGHLAGDECLKEVARVLKETIRSTDFLARWGGDEFIFVLPDVSFEQVKEIAQRAKTAVEKVGETISVGIAFGIPEQDFGTIDEMIKAADEKMYEEKKIFKQIEKAE